MKEKSSVLHGIVGDLASAEKVGTPEGWFRTEKGEAQVLDVQGGSGCNS